MKTIRFFIVPLVILVTNTLQAQQVFEDAQGETSFYTNPKSQFGWVKINSSATSFSTGYNYFDLTGDGFKLTWGANASVGVKNGIGSLVKNSQLSPGVSFGGLIGGIKFLEPNNNLLAIYLRLNTSFNEYSIVDGVDIKSPANSPANSNPSLVTNRVWGRSALIHVNSRVNVRGVNPDDNKDTIDVAYHLIGASVGYKRGDNFSTLKEVQTNTPVASNTALSVSSITTSRIGPFNELDAFVVNGDYGFLPTILGQKIIGFNTYFRTEFSKSQTLYNHGIGIFFSRLDQPSSIVGGLAWQFNDICNAAKSDKTVLERSTVFFYIGYTIGTNK